MGDLGVAVQHLDVLERDPEPVRDDLAERRLVALPVRARAGDDLDLPVGSIRTLACSQPASRSRGCPGRATARGRTSR